MYCKRFKNLFVIHRYTHILQIIAVVLITLGLFGKVFNCIIFLRKPVCNYNFLNNLKLFYLILASWYNNRFNSFIKNNI